MEVVVETENIGMPSNGEKHFFIIMVWWHVIHKVLHMYFNTDMMKYVFLSDETMTELIQCDYWVKVNIHGGKGDDSEE